jgi:hypothetical protein
MMVLVEILPARFERATAPALSGAHFQPVGPLEYTWAAFKPNTNRRHNEAE